MKKFLVTVTQTTEVEVKIDPAEMNEAWMAEYRKDFTNVKTIEQHAGRIGLWMALGLQSCGNYIEGYGYVRTGNEFRRFSYSDDAEDNPTAPRMNINVRRVSEGTKVKTEEIMEGG